MLGVGFPTVIARTEGSEGVKRRPRNMVSEEVSSLERADQSVMYMDRHTPRMWLEVRDDGGWRFLLQYIPNTI